MISKLIKKNTIVRLKRNETKSLKISHFVRNHYQYVMGNPFRHIIHATPCHSETPFKKLKKKG